MHLLDQQLNNMIRGNFEEGWRLAEILEQDDPTNPRYKFNRGWFLINRGHLQEGYRCLEYGRSINVYGSGELATHKPLWKQEDLTGKVLLINLEGGWGDCIMQARWAIEVRKRGGRAVLCCDQTLHSICNRIPGVQECITFDQVRYTWHDYWLPGFSGSWVFGYDERSFPGDAYITAMPEKVETWKRLLSLSHDPSKTFRIGIRWSGNPEFEHQQFRIFPAELLIDLHKLFPQVQFYSLQRDNDIRELPAAIQDLQHHLLTWEDTAGCVANLDLVISSCTSVAHLSAAMGQPTWVLVPLLPYHVWTHEGVHSPWYPKTTRVFRQNKFSSWQDPFEEIKQCLTSILQSKNSLCTP